MSQYTKTICAHNAEGQILINGVQTYCRKCGAKIIPEAQGVNPTGNISTEAVFAKYPAEP
jgi:hypothetical protein